MTRSRAVSLVAALALAVAPFAAAADPLSVFQPSQVRPVSVDMRGLHALPPLDAFGTVHGERFAGMENAATPSAAAAIAGYALRLPTVLPPDVGREAQFYVTRRVRTTFTFEAAKAAAWAREQKVALHPLPPGLDGATYTGTLEPVTMTMYGARATTVRHGVRRGAFLGVVQAPVPTIAASGASVATLASWFTQQPGIPPALVRQIEALGDPAQTLPIPIPMNLQAARTVAVDGVNGYAFGDETGIGAVIVWTKNGKLFAVGGTVAESELRAVVDSLKG
ncbi:MAG TPA: hypothetical protein VHT53_02320 [Candidatus Elarobacter sp.]|jgi:hypothetical protein|nr:hypothetical protein [Candidatus Elarobacter sp.]